MEWLKSVPFGTRTEFKSKFGTCPRRSPVIRAIRFQRFIRQVYPMKGDNAKKRGRQYLTPRRFALSLNFSKTKNACAQGNLSAAHRF